MSDAKSTKQTLPQNEGSREGHDGCPVGDPDAADAVVGNRKVAEWFKAACEALAEKDEVLARELGVDRAYLARMREGQKSIPLRHVLRFIGHREAVLTLVAPLLESVGMAAVMRPKMSKRQAAERIAAAVRKVATLYPVVREMAAREAGVEAEQFDVALDGFGEVTKV